MKTGFLSLCCLLSLLFSHTVNAACAPCLEQNNNSASASIEKMYLQEQQIVFQNSKIYINLNGAIFTVSSVFSDQNGYYILVKQPRGRCEPYEWKCGRCGTCNEFEESYCISCGREME